MDNRLLEAQAEAGKGVRRVTLRGRQDVRIRPVRAAFYLFLMGFFLYCTRVTAGQIVSDANLRSALSDFLLRCGL